MAEGGRAKEKSKAGQGRSADDSCSSISFRVVHPSVSLTFLAELLVFASTLSLFHYVPRTGHLSASIDATVIFSPFTYWTIPLAWFSVNRPSFCAASSREKKKLENGQPNRCDSLVFLSTLGKWVTILLAIDLSGTQSMDSLFAWRLLSILACACFFVSFAFTLRGSVSSLKMSRSITLVKSCVFSFVSCGNEKWIFYKKQKIFFVELNLLQIEFVFLFNVFHKNKIHVCSNGWRKK